MRTILYLYLFLLPFDRLLLLFCLCVLAHQFVVFLLQFLVVAVQVRTHLVNSREME